MVLRKHRGRLHYCLRAKWPVRYFVVRHVQRTLASLSRRYCARAALGQRADGEQKDREAVREFEQSLPPDRQKIYFLLLTAAIVVVFRLITPAVVGLLETKPSRSWDIQQLRDISTKIIGAINPSGTSVNEAVNAVLGGGIWDDGALTLGVMVSGYVVLRPLMPAFRLKRMLFNLAPEPERRHRSAVARWSVSQSTGLYDRERRVFAELDSRPPAEFPLDLAVSTVATVVPLTLCGILVRLAIASPELRSQAYTSAAWVLVAVLVRLAWLWRTWRRRELGRSGPFTPYEVRIRAGRAIAKVEYPVGVRQLLFLLFFVSFAFKSHRIPAQPRHVPPVAGAPNRLTDQPTIAQAWPFGQHDGDSDLAGRSLRSPTVVREVISTRSGHGDVRHWAPTSRIGNRAAQRCGAYNRGAAMATPHLRPPLHETTPN